MALFAGARLGPYEILGLIGAGGMGEVYRARDFRLDRVVAIKVLPEHHCGDSKSRERFEREAKTISNLSHPHICTVHDVGHEDGVDFLVMEYLDGETLARRLERGPLPTEQVLHYGVQVADALDTAHRHGVIHRDLKPGNIMLVKSGAKLLDFGLAKVRGAEAVAGATLLSTATIPLTAEGTILGTIHYMAPEQLEGQEADARTDIFALGAVLYEMATGRRAFQGKSPASVISAIMSADPPPLGTPEAAPHGLERVIGTCLAKDPDARWQSVHDVTLALTWLQQDARRPASPARARRQAGIRVAVAAAAVVAATAVAVDYFRSIPPPVQAVRSSLLPPLNHFFQRGNFSVSPDGTRLAFVAVAPDGSYKLWVRALSAPSAQELTGTDGARLPFWAPDSRRIGFFAGGKLNTVDIATSALRILCDAPVGRDGGTWNSDGTIVFAPALTGPLYKISDTGGGAIPVTKIPRRGSSQRQTWPFFLPDGKHFLYAADWNASDGPDGDGVYVGSTDGSEAKLVSTELSGNVIFAAGHLLYGRDRSLRVQPFDLRRLQTTGSATSIAEQELEEDPGFSHSEFSVSQNGVLVFQSLADSVSRLMWFDRMGKELGQIAEHGYRDPRLSPDGRFLAVSADDAGNGKFFVRLYDLERGTATRLTDEEREESPTWSHDGKRIAYGTYDGRLHYLKTVPVDRSSPPEVLVKGPGIMRHLDWSSNGDLLFSDFSNGPPVIKVYSPADRRVVAFGSGSEGRFSPDGRWIAFVGFNGIFVQPFATRGGRIEISSTGAQPNWARDGGEIFYIAPDRKLIGVRFDAKKRWVGPPRVIFQTRIVAPAFFGTQYDISGDDRFLINSVPSNYSSPLTLVTGWTVQLRR